VTSSGDYGLIVDRVNKVRLSGKASDNFCQASDKTKMESLPDLFDSPVLLLHDALFCESQVDLDDIRWSQASLPISPQRYFSPGSHDCVVACTASFIYCSYDGPSSNFCLGAPIVRPRTCVRVATVTVNGHHGLTSQWFRSSLKT